MAEATRALDLATRLAIFGQGAFDLGLVALPTPADEQAFAAALSASLAERDITLRRLSADALLPDPLAAVGATAPAQALLVTGLHGGHEALARRLNIQRDSLVRAWPAPWIIAGHPEGIRTLASFAPDFTDFASRKPSTKQGGPVALTR